MSDISYLWDGIVTGDATEAPYGKISFNQWLNLALTSDTGDILVIPEYLNNLEVSNISDTAYSIAVNTGAAILKNLVYILEESESFSVSPPSSTSIRFDILVLRADYNNQNVKLAIVEGVENTSYYDVELPSLTQLEGILWEAPLAYLMVSGSSISVAGNYKSVEFEDKRKFIINNSSRELYNSEQLLYNSEYIAEFNSVPEMWVDESASFSINTYLSDYMSRGRSISGQMYQEIDISLQTGEPLTCKLCGVFGSATPVQVMFMEVTGITSSGNETTPQRRYKILEDTISQFIFQNTFTFSKNIVRVRVRVGCNTDGKIGQILLVKGYHPGGFRLIHEIVYFINDITDAAWNNSPKSTGNTLIDLTASFGPHLVKSVRGIFSQQKCRDSGSAAALTYLAVRDINAVTTYGAQFIVGITNDTYRTRQAVNDTYIDVSKNGNASIKYNEGVGASGAGTLDATVKIIGIVT